MSHYEQTLPRTVICRVCNKIFKLRIRQMWFHCGTAVKLRSDNIDTLE